MSTLLRRTLWTAAIPLAFVFTSRLVGLGREVIIAAAFGLSAATDGFYQLSAVPTYLITYVTGPFATAYIAWATSANAPPEARHLPVISRWIGRIALGIAVAFAAISLGVALNRPHDWSVLLAISLTAVACVMLVRVGLGAAVSNARARFGQAQGILFVNNLVFVVLLGLSVVAGVRSHILLILAGAFCAASICAALFAQHMVGRGNDPAPVEEQPKVGEAIRRGLIPNLLYASVETGGFLLTQAVVLMLATSSGVGVVSAASLAQRICLSANGLLVNPLSNIAMVHTARRERDAQRRFAFYAVAATLGGLTLVAAVLIFARLWLPELVGTSSRFSADNAELLASLVPAYSLWLIAQGTSMMVSRLSFVMGRARLFTIATTVGYGIAIAGRILVWHAMDFASAIALGAAIEAGVAIAIFIALVRHRNTGIADVPAITREART